MLMIPYLLFLFIVMFLLIKYKQSNNEKLFGFIFIIVFLFCALRGNGSGDYFTYLEYSTQINSIGDLFNMSFPMEIGFRFFSLIKNALHLHDQFIIIFMNMVSIGLTYYSINKYGKYKVLSTIIFLPILLQYDMHATRSAVAASLVCISYFSFIENKYKKSLLFFLGSICFHRSVMIILLFPIFLFIKSKLKTRNYAILCSSFLILSLFPVFKFVPYFIEQLGISNIYVTKLYNYMYVSEFAYPMNIFDPRILLYIALFILSIIVLHKFKTKKFVYISLLLYLNLICLFLFRDSTFLALRFSSFFERILIIEIPILIMEFRIDSSKNKCQTFIKLINNYKDLITATIYILYFIALVLLTCVPYKLFI